MAKENQSESEEDKTEEPSQQRIDDFRKEGQVAQSKELTSLLVLLCTLGVLYGMGPSLGQDFMDFMRKIFSESANSELTANKAGVLLSLCLSQAAKLVMPIAIAGFVAGILGSILQFGFLFTWTPLTPEMDRINPLNGLDRKSTRLNSSHSQQSRMPSSA